jgi:hypothetical protein
LIVPPIVLRNAERAQSEGRAQEGAPKSAATTESNMLAINRCQCPL